MNENEKKLFYSVLKEKITEEPASDLVTNIMYIVRRKAHKKMVVNKLLEVLGCTLLGVFAVGFLYFYTDFKPPILNFDFELPSRIYLIIMSVIFVFALIELYFRKRLYEKSY